MTVIKDISATVMGLIGCLLIAVGTMVIFGNIPRSSSFEHSYDPFNFEEEVRIPPSGARHIQLIPVESEVNEPQEETTPLSVPSLLCKGNVKEEGAYTYRTREETITGRLERNQQVILLAFSRDLSWVITDFGWIRFDDLLVHVCAPEVPVIEY